MPPRRRSALLLILACFALMADRAAAQTPGLERREWTIRGVKREALVHVPATAKDAAAPVVFAFHGHGGSMTNGARMFRVHELWPEAITVYMHGLPTAGRLTDPEGQRRGWQHTIGADQDRDLEFFDAVWDTLKNDYKVDEARVYVTGHSNGGGFTYLLWAARGDLFAAVAPSSAVPSREELPLLEPKPVLHVAGEQDDLVKYAWQKVAMDQLRKLNGCDPEGQAWAKFATRYPSPKGAPVTTYIHPGGHRLPGEVPAVLVSFFKENQKPGRAKAETRPMPPAPAESQPATRETGRARQPNIVIFLADDLGYGDIGVQGCKDIPTPNIDAIAKAGVRCTSGYPGHCVCAPSRASLMAGTYQHRFGLEQNPGPQQTAAQDYGFPRNVPTLAEKLKALGYATGMVGKWHLGYSEGLRPHERGFDSHFGFLGGAHPYLSGRRGVGTILRNGVPVDEKEYLTDAFAREALAFIDQKREQPYFLYFAFNAVHAPLQAASKYEARFPEIADPKRRTYAGMVSALDDAVGRVMARIRERGEEENTLVFFYSDNGGPTQTTTSRNDPLRGFKGQLWEGGIRTPNLVQWKGKLPAGTVFDPPVMAFDIHATALAAAGAERVTSVQDGVPNPRPTRVGVEDGAPNPRPTRVGVEDGVDLVPFLTGANKGVPHDVVFWRAGQAHAARAGDWKLVRDRTGGDQLFNLKDDLGEKSDLAAREPAKLAELQAAYTSWEKQMAPQRARRRAAAARPVEAESRPATRPADDDDDEESEAPSQPPERNASQTIR